MIEVGRHADPFPALLTTSVAKATLYSVDTYFAEAWADLSAATTDPVRFAWEHGLLVLKPDAFAGRRAHVILEWLDDAGFVIADARRLRFDRHSIRAEWRYQWNMATPDRKKLMDVLLNLSDCMLVIVRSRDPIDVPATVRLTDLKGPAEVAKRRPDHLRWKLGLSSAILSFLHTADEPADVVREFGIHAAAPERIALLERLACRPDATCGAWALCDELYAEVPFHDLDPAEIGRRLEQAADPDLGGDLDQGELRRLAPQLREGECTQWSKIPGLARRCGAAFGVWDEVVLTAANIVPNFPGRESVLRTEPRDWVGLSAELNSGASVSPTPH
jgi:nucleoside diphosphate kinase